MAAAGVTFPRVLLLRIIAARGRSSSKDLATVMGVTTANLPGLLDKLEADGYVTRKRDATDRRVVLVEATSGGRKKLKELWRAGMQELGKEFEDWTDRDLQTLRDLLTRVASTGCSPDFDTELPMVQPARHHPNRAAKLEKQSVG